METNGRDSEMETKYTWKIKDSRGWKVIKPPTQAQMKRYARMLESGELSEIRKVPA